MADYNFKDDGKIHTRYSELVRCTAGQIDTVIAERFGERGRVETESMLAGTERHQMFQDEAEKTRRVPKIFNLDWPVSHIEEEFTTEILPGIVVHSRVDLLCASIGLIPDYKTVVDGKQGWQKIVESYRHGTKQRQLKFYAFQVGMHKIRVNKGAFLCEIWNSEHDTILGHEIIEFNISLADMAETLAWAKPRAAMLAAAIETYNAKNRGKKTF